MSSKDSKDRKPHPVNEKLIETFDLPRRFNPTQSEASDLWRKSLEGLRDRFAKAALDQRRLTCVLSQSIVPEWPEWPELPTIPEINGMEMVAFGGGLLREPEQLFGKRRIRDQVSHEPLIGDRRCYDAEGKPILFPDGKPVAIRLGAVRRFKIYGKGSERHATLDAFISAGNEAGRTLFGLPVDVNMILWRDWLTGINMVGNDYDLWVYALYELAFLHFAGSPLAAKKFAWIDSLSVPLDSLPNLRLQAQNSETMARLADIPDPPAHWYAVIEDLLSASVAAIDSLLEIGDKAPPIPTEARPQTIEQIERQTPELDTKSVEWIAARKENEKKLGLPTDTLRKYRAPSSGGRKMPDEMFGVDRDGRRWRRKGTSKSTVYYYEPSLPKRRKKR